MAKLRYCFTSLKRLGLKLQRNLNNYIIKGNACIFRTVVGFLSLLFNFISAGYLPPCIHPKRYRLCTVVGSLLLLVSFISAGYLLPVPISFEGNLIVDRIGFISKERVLLFNKVKIDKITLKGKQAHKFSGDISSGEEPRLAKLGELEIRLENEESYLTISSISRQISLELSELSLLENTEVRQLLYIPERQFHLETSVFGKLSDDYRPLQLNIGNPVQIFCRGECSIPSLNLFNQESFSFVLQAIGEIQPVLPSHITLDIELHGSEKEPFFGNLNVGRVKLVKDQKHLDNDEYSFSKSAILSGVIRIAGQNLDIEKEQFLILGRQAPTDTLTDGLQGIQKIRYIHVIYPEQSEELQVSDKKIQLSNPLPGMEIGISGETARLAIGINPYLPIKVIQGNFFSKFPSDVMNFLNIVFAALFGSLLTWLFDKLPKT